MSKNYLKCKSCGQDLVLEVSYRSHYRTPIQTDLQPDEDETYPYEEGEDYFPYEEKVLCPSCSEVPEYQMNEEGLIERREDL